MGFDDMIPFEIWIKKGLEPSAWTDHPSRNATGLYKFISNDMFFDLEKMVVTRQTYDLLSWLGDIGGLGEALYYIGHMLVGPFAAFNSKSILLANLFRN